MKRIILTPKNKSSTRFKIQKHKNLSLRKHSLFTQYLICFITVRKKKEKEQPLLFFGVPERRPNAFQQLEMVPLSTNTHLAFSFLSCIY